MDWIDSCVIGGGVVGLAVARALASTGAELVVLDSEPDFGQGISSRNSEVIHAGIYYARDSLKALLCVSGKRMLYQYLEERGLGYRRCGKLIVATSSAEEAILESIQTKAAANDVVDLEYWTGARIRDAEPSVNAVAGLWSPSTGIVSSHDLMASYLGDIEGHGGMFVGNTQVVRVDRPPGGKTGFVVTCVTGPRAAAGEGEKYSFGCNTLVNSAGLGAQRLGTHIEGINPESVPPLYLCKGNYFVMSGANPFNHLIYPVPHPSGAGLGVHATIDLGGQVKFGPDVEYIDDEDFSVSETRLSEFYEAVRRYYPGLTDGALVPGYTGIRPKLQGPGDTVRDFVISSEADHGVARLVQLFGIESPGLTSSLALAQHVKELLDD